MKLARLSLTFVLGMAALVTLIYLWNPLGTASKDPRLRLWGIAPIRHASYSMEPTIRKDQVVFVSAWSYLRSKPEIGDLVVFQYPLDRSSSFIKRVVATGGSTVALVDGVTVVDGKPIDEPYLRDVELSSEYAREMRPVSVPPDSYFVLGDNRGNSSDSRIWGSVPRAYFIGKVIE